MRALSVLFSGLSAASLASAGIIPFSFLPQLTDGPPVPANSSNCLPKGVAVNIVNSFTSLLTAFSPMIASNLLAPNFTDTSASINFLANQPLDGYTFPSPGAFIGGQAAQPPIAMSLLSVDAVTCDGVIVFRWSASVNPSAPKIKGINVLYTTYVGGAKGSSDSVGPKGWQISSVFSEFNSAAWVNAIGGSCVSPTAAAASSAASGSG